MKGGSGHGGVWPRRTLCSRGLRGGRWEWVCDPSYVWQALSLNLQMKGKSQGLGLMVGVGV